MGRVVTHEYGQPKGILKFFPYEGKAVLVPETMASADANGKKIVKAGTPFPKNDATCEGYLLYDVDVTNGDAVATAVYQGTIDNAKLTANGVSVAAAAKSATPRVSFMD